MAFVVRRFSKMLQFWLNVDCGIDFDFHIREGLFEVLPEFLKGVLSGAAGVVENDIECIEKPMTILKTASARLIAILIKLYLMIFWFRSIITSAPRSPGR